MTSKPETNSVAIVGGGIAGLTCAQQLADYSFNVSLFNTGKRGMGGLLATRSCSVQVDSASHSLCFDTAAQLFSASHPQFRSLCERWERLGWIRRWIGRAIQISADGSTKDLYQSSEAHVYAAIGGMEQLAARLSEALQAKGASTRAQMWASSAERTPDGRWDVKWDLWSMKVSDYLVIAHSGKCAKRLTSSRGLERCHDVVRRVQLGAVWCVAFVFAESLRVPFEVAAVEGCDEIAWIGNQTAKLGTESDAVECWVLLSTNAYGWRHKVPQEFVPDELKQDIGAELLGAFGKLLSVSREGKCLPSVLHQHVQLWGAALPGSILENSDAVFDPVVRAGVCADWCVAPCIEGAVLSGLRLADLIRAHHSKAPGAACTMHPQEEPRFRKCRHVCEIAAFPGWFDPATAANVAGTCQRHTERSCSSTISPIYRGSRRTRWHREGDLSNLEEVGEQLITFASPTLLDSLSAGVTGKDPKNKQVDTTLGQSDRSTQAGGKVKRWRSKQQASILNGCDTVRERKPQINELMMSPGGGVVPHAAGSCELYPGLVLLRDVLSPAAQQWLADETSELGGLFVNTASATRSEGFFRASLGGRRDLNVCAEGRGSFVLRLSECNPYFLEICLQCFQVASALSTSLPEMKAEACAFNYYAENSQGMRWHRDIDEIGDSIRSGIGRPVVSISLGDACDFDYRPVQEANTVQKIHLRSGDALVFGGPSRGFMHAVTRIYPGERPSALSMERGRLNLTFRHHA